MQSSTIGCGDDDDHSWIMHMAEKEWVDLEDFAEALRVARIFERGY
jgi:hypothetical protein